MSENGTVTSFPEFTNLAVSIILCYAQVRNQMQTRENVENVGFIGVEVGSQADRDLLYRFREQDNSQKTSKSQNQKSECRRY